MSDAPAPTEEELAAGDALFARPWRFIRGVADLEQLPPADRPEVAFAGRSNVGKSSLLNALARTGALARVSNTPGRTQELNVFAPADASLYLVDMPGYGFAKAPKEKVDAWTALVRAYLEGRPSLARVFLLIDARHGFMDNDADIMTLLGRAAVTFQIVLTKADKISRTEGEAIIAETAAVLSQHPAAFPHLLLTSSSKGTGMPALRATLASIASTSRS